MTLDPRKVVLLGNDAAIMMEEEEDEDEDELFEVPDTDEVMATTTSSSGFATSGAQAFTPTSRTLISNFITPSPFPHHTTGPTSSRFRNAFTRITADPSGDTEAWQALMTEVSNCFKSLQQQGSGKLHLVDAEVQLQLDWIESCYGTLLKYFPYSSHQAHAMGQILYAQSARVGEVGGPLSGMGVDHQRQVTAQAKLDVLLERALGAAATTTTTTATVLSDGSVVAPATATADPNDNNTTTTTNARARLGGMCTASVDLWSLYLLTRIRQARRDHPTSEIMIHQQTVKAYELALEHAGFGPNNHVLWKVYLQYLKPNPGGDAQHLTTLRAVYQRLVCHPMTGLDQLWQEYEQWERQQSEALAQALVAELTPKYQHARTIYLERNRVLSTADHLQADRWATPPNPDELSDEHASLQAWKTRAAYERTNPERLISSELSPRVRSVYKEMACAWTHHPEVWHMWSVWEESSVSVDTSTTTTTTTPSESSSSSSALDRALAVLEVAQSHILDCTLLANAQAQLIELHTSTPKDCLITLRQSLDRAPTTLGFTLYQQRVRRYQGKEQARAVFAQARRVLTIHPKDVVVGGKTDEEHKKDAAAAAVKGDGGGVDDTMTDAVTQDPTSSSISTSDGTKRRFMVTNRLEASVGTNHGAATKAGASATTTTMNDTLAPVGDTGVNGGISTSITVKPGPITWHLYASHATIEHRLNHAPAIAARIYELGLRKHASFLTQPSYVLRYAQLLLELQDTVNLRALLTRALAACASQATSPAIAALWDRMLEFESLVSLQDPSNVAAVVAVERKRRAALLGPEIEDVATGFRVGMGGAVPIGAQKSTIAEQLIRQDGYDLSSTIVNGMSRSVDVLDVMGLWGSGGTGSGSSSGTTNLSQSLDEDELIPGGKSDAAYQKRLHFTKLLASGGRGGGHAMGGEDNVGGGGSRLLLARERLQGGGSAALASQNTAMTMAIQNSPEWLRELLFLLPASRLRTPIVAKPPPHLTEMALATLRQGKLPSERPQGDKKKSSSSSGTKHKLDGDSSDEEGPLGSGGYGSQFRARQRARQMASAQNGSRADM